MKPSRMGVRILVNDFAKMFDFYKNIMGYEVFWGARTGTYAAFNVPGDDNPAFSIFKKEGYHQYEGYKDIGDASKSDHIVLTIGHEDIDEYYEYLKSKGVDFIGKPRNMLDWEYRCVLMRDPEGNLIDVGGPIRKKEGAKS